MPGLPQNSLTDTRRYQIGGVLGKGGFGTVYRAEMLGAGGFRKPVALKVLNPEMADVGELAARLRDEARLLALLRHRSLIQVDGLVLLDGLWTIVMELVDGVDLRQILKDQGQFPLAASLELVQEVASALYAAYDRPAADGEPLRVLHRDIKPSNIRITAGGEVKVLDFGVARGDFADREVRTRSWIFGSQGYMAPERITGIDSHAADVYALGVVLFECLTGEPYGPCALQDSLHQERVAGGAAIMRRCRIPEGVVDLVTRCMEWHPSARPCARELERNLRDLRREYQEPWLTDWVEPHIIRLQRLLLEGTGPLSGRTLSEQAIREPVPSEIPEPVLLAEKVSPFKPPAPPEAVDATSPSDDDATTPSPRPAPLTAWLREPTLAASRAVQDMFHPDHARESKPQDDPDLTVAPADPDLTVAPADPDLTVQPSELMATDPDLTVQPSELVATDPEPVPLLFDDLVVEETTVYAAPPASLPVPALEVRPVLLEEPTLDEPTETVAPDPADTAPAYADTSAPSAVGLPSQTVRPLRVVLFTAGLSVTAALALVLWTGGFFASSTVGPTPDPAQEVTPKEQVILLESVVQEDEAPSLEVDPGPDPSVATEPLDASAPPPVVSAESKAPVVAPAPPRDSPQPPPAPPTTGLVQVRGQGISISLIGKDKTWQPGRVPPGVYTVIARFPTAERVNVGEIVVEVNTTIIIECRAEGRTCAVRH